MSDESKLNDLLCGVREAVAELRAFREIYEEHPTAENRANIRFGEMSVIQMAESLIDKTT